MCIRDSLALAIQSLNRAGAGMQEGEALWTRALNVPLDVPCRWKPEAWTRALNVPLDVPCYWKPEACQ
eukprot:3706071-Alexandrium_andersonii.AAC.1